jgi:transposase-like protein
VNSSAAASPRFPTEAGGIQVNFCKNPACANYGIPPKVFVPGAAAARSAGLQDSYKVQTGGGGLPVLGCHLCGEFPPIKSNAAIDEERTRFLADLAERLEASCPDESCPNHAVPVSRGWAYQSFGLTKSGSQRYRCKTCRKTFAVGKSTTRHKQPHKNRLVFSLLMNKSPLRRICEVADLGPEALYGKIEFLYQQCLAFAARREAQLLSGMSMPRLYLATDRQDYGVNWNRREDRRNIVLHAVGTADNTTAYVFGMHLNYDPDLDVDETERQAIAAGDYLARAPFRQFARCWLKQDYDAAVKAGRARRGAAGRGLDGDIDAAYNEADQREDVEISEVQDVGRRLPTRGMQIHAEYSLYGHFFFLKRLLGGVEKLRFFVDQDSGMRAACLAAFQPEIAARRADAFYVRVAKDLTITAKRKAIADSRAIFEAACKANPGLSETEVKTRLIKDRIAQMVAHGKWQDKWLTHPFPMMSEPEKAVCYLTNYGDYDEDHLAQIYNKASLHGIDRFFMQVRRRLSILERPIITSSANYRTWYGYSAYNPATIVKLLGIFRVFYNYCVPGKDKKTPAMRLGLAKGKVALEDLIYFSA